MYTWEIVSKLQKVSLLLMVQCVLIGLCVLCLKLSLFLWQYLWITGWEILSLRDAPQWKQIMSWVLEIIVVALSTRHILIFFFSIENRCKWNNFFVISKCMYGNNLTIPLSFSELTYLIYEVYCVLSVFCSNDNCTYFSKCILFSFF